MIDHFLNWLEQKANDYLIWMYEREARGAPICPDCEWPEPHCRCDEDARRENELDAAFDAGWERGMERAERPW